MWEEFEVLKGHLRAPPNSEFLHPATQRTWLELQYFRRAAGSLDSPTRLLKSFENLAAFDLFKTANRRTNLRSNYPT